MVDYEIVPFLDLIKLTKVHFNEIILIKAIMSTYDDRQTFLYYGEKLEL